MGWDKIELLGQNSPDGGTVERKVFESLKVLAPDLVEAIEKRALLLEQVALHKPIGRRQLAEKMKTSERDVRNLADQMKDQGLIAFQNSGMVLTVKGKTLLPFAEELAKNRQQILSLEEELSRKLEIKEVYISLGDIDEDPKVLNEVGRLAAQKLNQSLKDEMVLAVTGGSTIAKVAKHLKRTKPIDVMVVPARGGMGRNVAHQANTLAAEIGKKLGGQYRLMHLPDQMDAHAMQEMLRLWEVRETIDLLQKADVILHGVGRADEMAQSRNLPPRVLEELKERKAVAESFGYYFDEQGKFLYAASSIGVDLSRLKPNCQMMAVAAGRKKAKALLAVLRHHPHEMLITDEGAAREMLKLLKEDCTSHRDSNR